MSPELNPVGEAAEGGLGGAEGPSRVVAVSLRPDEALWRHWPEYLIEGWALGMFMIAAGIAVVLVEHPALPVRGLIDDPDLRRAIVGAAMGVTATALIYSRWGKQSGAHMNPAVTLTFVRLGKVRPIDGFFYIVAQLIGGTLGVCIAYLLTLGAPDQGFEHDLPLRREAPSLPLQVAEIDPPDLMRRP